MCPSIAKLCFIQCCALLCLCFARSFGEIASNRLVASSVSPHGKTRLPLDGFSLNLMFEIFFPKTGRETLNLIKI